MRIVMFRFNADGQEESSMLVEFGNRAKLPVRTYGRVGQSATWLWLHVPLKTNTGMFTSFGNQK
jgi:hypothetical protein